MNFKILVIRWSGMGDIIMALPAAKWLKDHFKNCHITFLTDVAFAMIPDKSGVVDRVVTIDRRGFGSIKTFFPAAWGIIRTVFHLRRQKFDMVFDLQGFGETAVLAWLSGAPVCVGRIKNSSLRKRIYNSPILADWENDHRSRYFLRAVAEACGAAAPEQVMPPELEFKFEEVNKVRQHIGLNLGASTESRRWSEQHFFELAKRLSRKGYPIRILLGPQERFLTKTTRQVCQENNWNYAFHTRMEALMKAVAQCRLLVSNDTGPGHLAAALGLPVITLFSSGTPENVKPLAREARWFRNETDINQISVPQVENACLDLLKSQEG